jgi:hypothetical protein
MSWVLSNSVVCMCGALPPVAATPAAYPRPVRRTGPDGSETEQALDDTDVGWGGPYDESVGAGDEDDRRLLEERPPHHDRP